MFNLGIMHLNNQIKEDNELFEGENRFNKSYELISKCALKNNSICLSGLGYIYWNGLGIA